MAPLGQYGAHCGVLQMHFGGIARLFASGFRMPEKLVSFGTLASAQLSRFAEHRAPN